MQQTLSGQGKTSGRAVVYLRVSTEEQAEHGAGLGAQREACARHAERLGLEVLGPFSDEGISGAAALDRRPGLLEATGRLVAGDILLVAKRDRLGRDPILVAMIEAGARRSGARVVSAAGEGTEGDDAGDVLMRRIVDAFAEYERLIIKSRTRAALESLRARGRVTSHPPYGYRAEDDGIGTKTSRGANPGKLVEDPAEQANIEIIRELDSLGFSPREIAAALDGRRIASRHRRPWSHQTVRNILTRWGPPRP